MAIYCSALTADEVSLEYEAGRRGKQVDPETFIEHYTLDLDPLPCWRHLPKEEIRRRITEMVDEIGLHYCNEKLISRFK